MWGLYKSSFTECRLRSRKNQALCTSPRLANRVAERRFDSHDATCKSRCRDLSGPTHVAEFATKPKSGMCAIVEVAYAQLKQVIQYYSAMRRDTRRFIKKLLIIIEGTSSLDLEAQRVSKVAELRYDTSWSIIFKAAERYLHPSASLLFKVPHPPSFVTTACARETLRSAARGNGLNKPQSLSKNRQSKEVLNTKLDLTKIKDFYKKGCW